MKRRGFLATLLGLVGVAAAPQVTAVQPTKKVFFPKFSSALAADLKQAWHAGYAEPRTAEELTKAIEGLFAEVKTIDRAFVDFAEPIGFGGLAEGPTYRVTPIVWKCEGPDEASLVKEAWADIVEEARGHARGTLFWRIKPKFVDEARFEGGRLRWLRFRFAIRPHDWRDRARLNSHQEWSVREARFIKDEGAPARRIS